MDQAINAIINAIGEDAQRPGLKDTPERVKKAWHEITAGYSMTLENIVGGALFPIKHSDMVVVNNIEFYSLCEHHLLPFFGKAHVAYIPNKKVIGLSKIPRIVDMFAKRLQVQERLSHEIAEAIAKATGAIGVGVIIEAEHMCMMMRGTQKQHASMRSSCYLGAMRSDPNLKTEMLQLLKAL